MSRIPAVNFREWLVPPVLMPVFLVLLIAAAKIEKTFVAPEVIGVEHILRDEGLRARHEIAIGAAGLCVAVAAFSIGPELR